jgi:nifR3 family TIM-barrel protein
LFKIGNISIKNKALLAPMAGISNPTYFRICEEFGLGYAVTELISSEAIVRDNKKTFDMLNGIDKLDIPFGIQIFGSNPEVMGKAASVLEERYKPSFIDINMGCPVPKVVKSGAGSYLMRDKKLVFDIVSSVVRSVSIPVTVKIRSGWDSNSINAKEIAIECEKAGASAIAVHARTRSQGYSGEADWKVIKEVKKSVSVPVIGNGDVKSLFDAERMISETGCDAVMIGRAALGNPWIIEECNEYLNSGNILSKPTFIDKVNMIKKHYELLKEFNGEKSALLEIRSHALWYLKGIPGIKSYKNLIVISKTEKEFLSVLDDILLTINDKNDKLYAEIDETGV